jgi:hypothetical protein
MPDEHPVEALVVDRDPVPVEVAQHDVGSGDPRVRDAHVGTDIAPDDHVAARRERALPSTGANGDRGRQRPAHLDNHIGW